MNHLLSLVVLLSVALAGSCLEPDQICDAYSSPGYTPWDSPIGWFRCQEGCIDEWWDCFDSWGDAEIAACIQCCNDFYFPVYLQ